MKRYSYLQILTGVAVVAALVSSCDDVRRTPGKIYMPDMAYSRAVETYVVMDSAVFTSDPAKRGHHAYYNAAPVAGTLRMGDVADINLPADSAGVAMANSLVNPLPPLTTKDSLEAARLFNINCAVCHGAKAEANGPVAEKVGGVKNIVAGSPGYTDGKLYHILTYGQNMMGSYASQLDRKQRWRIVQYIRSLEPKKAAAADVATATADTTKKKM
jgi:mono/diheme cytochrome c family protein